MALRDRVSEGERRMIDAFRAFLLSEDHDRAIGIFRELAEEYPDDRYVPPRLGLRYHHAKERNDEAAFLESIRCFPDDADRHFAIGEFYQEQGRRDEAAREFERARELDPSFAEAGENLARIGAARRPDGS